MLMQSKSYKLSGLYAVFPTWQRHQTLTTVTKILLELDSLNKNTFSGHQIPYTRIWIPKPGTKDLRPLNVPNATYRIHLRMLNDILNVWFESYNSPSQHGFRPAKGTLTAWNQLIPKIQTSPDIYEYDFRKFFDSINLTYMEKTLTEQGMPANISKRLTETLRSQPKNPSETIHAWTDETEKLRTYYHYQTGEYKTTLSPAETNTIRSHYETAKEKNPALSRKEYYYGVPQGFNISPTISTIILLKEFLTPEKESDILQYADDGIIFSSHAEEYLQFSAESGITTKASASRWVKRNNQWHHPLKFLGLEYNPETHNIEVNSRSGKHKGYHLDSPHLSAYIESAAHKQTLYNQGIEFISEKEGIIESIKNYDPRSKESPQWQKPTGILESHETLLKHKIMGKLQSILYNGGELEIEKIEQDFTYESIKGSWCEYENLRQTKLHHLGKPHIIGGKEIPRLTIWNSGSIANHNLYEKLSRQPKSYKLLSEQIGNDHS